MKKFLACFVVLFIAVSCLFVVNVKASVQEPRKEWNLVRVYKGQIVVGNCQISDDIFGWLPGPFHDNLINTYSKIRFDIDCWIWVESEQDITRNLNHDNVVLVFHHGETEQEVDEYIHSIFGNLYSRDISYFNHPNNIPPPPPAPPPQPSVEPTLLIKDQATYVTASASCPIIIVGRIKILTSGDPYTNGVWRQMWRADCNNPAAVTITASCYIKAFDEKTYMYPIKIFNSLTDVQRELPNLITKYKNDYCSRTGARFQDINDFVWPN